MSASERQETDRKREREREGRGREKEREGREREGDRDIDGRRGLQFKRRRRPISARGYSLCARAGGGLGSPGNKQPLVRFCVIVQVYRQCTRARFATPTGPPAYNGCAEGCTMANKHTGFVSCFFFFFLSSARQLVRI